MTGVILNRMDLNNSYIYTIRVNDDGIHGTRTYQIDENDIIDLYSSFVIK